MASPTSVTLLGEDGTGPSDLAAVQRVLEQLRLGLQLEHCPAGEEVLRSGDLSGISQQAFDSARRTGVVLKSRLHARAATGERGANRLLPLLLDCHTRVVPARSLPGSVHPNVDILLLHECSEGQQHGLERQQTPGVVESTTQTSRAGMERFVALAAGVATAWRREQVITISGFGRQHLSDRMFRHGVEQACVQAGLAVAHKDVEDVMAALLVSPQELDTVVAPAIHGPWLAPLVAGCAGHADAFPVAWLGGEAAVFETGGVEDGRSHAAPLMLSAALMLHHMGQGDAALEVEHALVCALEEDPTVWSAPAPAVAEAVCARLGQRSERWRSALPRRWLPLEMPNEEPAATTRRVVGVDLFVQSGSPAAELAVGLETAVRGSAFKLKLIIQRGQRAFPGVAEVRNPTDLWCCRFMLRESGGAVLNSQVLELLVRVATAHRWVRLEKLQEMAGEPGYGRPATEDAG